MAEKKVVIGLVVKVDEQETMQILTATRTIKTTGYNPHGDNTQEAMCETVQDGEDYHTALYRGFEEELGLQRDDIRMIIESTSEKFSTRPGNEMILWRPFGGVRQTAGDQTWEADYCCLVVVGSDWEPDPQDGEVSEIKWWSVEELYQALEEDKSQFFSLSYPFIVMIVELLREGKLELGKRLGCASS